MSRISYAFVASIVIMLCAMSGASTAATPNATATESGTTQSDDISVWAESAPLDLMIRQLAGMSDLEVTIDGELAGQVSGRFSGSLEDALSELTSLHGVLFDVQGEILHATGQSESSSVSIALSGAARVKAVTGSLGKSDATWSGNSVEFREDAVRISGHPNFVKRTARELTTEIAALGGKSPEEVEASLVEMSISLDIGEPVTDDSVADAGSDAMLQDIQQEGNTESDRASAAEPIRWVTDIPGFTTF